MSDALVPVTVLTGYLGAGKTTLLNRILTENHGRRYAVVINEFGELGVDGDLVVDADEEVFEMNNGCVCCTVRGDLIRIVGGLMKRSKKFDGIIIETTGLANPAPVAQTFFVDDGVRARTRLDAIVTVVDAKNLPARLGDSTEAAAQIAFGTVRSALARACIAAIYTIPAVVTGYYAARGVIELCVPGAFWRQVFSIIGAAVVGVVSYSRFAAVIPLRAERDQARASPDTRLAAP